MYCEVNLQNTMYDKGPVITDVLYASIPADTVSRENQTVLLKHLTSGVNKTQVTKTHIKHGLSTHEIKMNFQTLGGKTQLTMSHINANIKLDFFMCDICFTNNPHRLSQQPKWLVGFRCVVINYVITYPVKCTSSRKLDVVHDNTKQLIISCDESFSLANRFIFFVS